MSQTESVSQAELLELIQSEPGEAFRKHADTLREMREEVESDRVRKLIDHALEKYTDEGV